MPVQCEFCGKLENQVRVMIAGPTQYICDECVELCMDILNINRGMVDGEAEYLSWDVSALRSAAQQPI